MKPHFVTAMILSKKYIFFIFRVIRLGSVRLSLARCDYKETEGGGARRRR